MKFRFNGFVFLLAVLFFLEQNFYFGWVWFPQSGSEVIADGITFLLVAMSFRN